MNADCTCGCCAGISVQTPQGETNLPGLPAIAYRTGAWATFRESMLARLSSADYPALAALKTRDDDDFTIALLDASAIVFDILTFYQERLANESYLRTATQLYSLVQLSQLIGYQPSPGVSASVYLAFTIRAATGLPPDPTTPAVTIPAGTQVQSVPKQGAAPQSFETSSDILAKADWNALPVQAGIPWTPQPGDTFAYLSGTATQLNPGDAILIVGDERIGNPASERWDLRIVESVATDAVNARTLVRWSEGLGAPGVVPSSSDPTFYAVRQRAALFGYNAVNPLMLASKTYKALQGAGYMNASGRDWKFGTDTSTGEDLGAHGLVDLDAAYPKITPGNWLALSKPDADTSRSPSGWIDLYQVTAISSMTRSDYGLSAKISRVTTDALGALLTDLDAYYDATRSASAFTQCEALPPAEQPLDYPLYGTCVDLTVVRDDLAGVAAIAIVGKSQKLIVKPGVATLSFVPDDETTPVTLAPGTILTAIAPPNDLNADGSVPDWGSDDQSITLRVADTQGRTGSIACSLSDFTLAASASTDPVTQECAVVSSVQFVTEPFAHTRIVLASPLLNCYDRSVTAVNANVGPATAGASVAELLGNGSATTPNQTFTLKQSPLTYVQAVTPTGRLSTLDVTVNGVTWEPLATLYAAPPAAQAYTTVNLPGGGTQVVFGDGVEGATLPTGQSNVRASFRVGLGAAGNVGPGSLTTLVNRPLGVSAVANPQAATGGQDADTIDDIRSDAPLPVLTLGRAVSIVDYQNFAGTFAGIAKASAVAIPSGAFKGVFITVAGAGGAALPAGNLTLANLVTSLQTYGNPNVALWVQSFLETTFALEADVAYDPAYQATAVEASIRTLLTQTYGFAARTFGQGVSGDEIAALVAGVAGVIAVNVKSVSVVATSAAGDLGSAAYSVSAYNAWLSQALPTPLPRPCAGLPMVICPYTPAPSPGALPLPAEIFVLDPDPKQLVLGVMT